MRATTSLWEAGAQLAGSADGCVPAGKVEGLGEGAQTPPTLSQGCAGTPASPPQLPDLTLFSNDKKLQIFKKKN